MQSGADTGKRRSMASDSELLRRIGHDLRSLYAEVIRQPLPIPASESPRVRGY